MGETRTLNWKVLSYAEWVTNAQVVAHHPPLVSVMIDTRRRYVKILLGTVRTTSGSVAKGEKTS